ncbi:unnamed protein product, partial [Brachionus calyciflorus]
ARYGLINVERVTIGDDNPINKIRANAETILNYIEAIKNGIHLDATSKRHKVVPSIIYGKVCNKCGSLKHRETFCQELDLEKLKYLKCSEIGHDHANCKSTKIRCLNSNGELYFTLRNNYVLSILLGEKLIKDKYT